MSAAELLDPDSATVVLSPLTSGQGAWVGCPTALYELRAGRYWLSYRHRRPRGSAPDRGWRCGIAVSTNGADFEEVWSVEKSELRTPSMERFCLAHDPVGDGYLLFVSYVDPVDSRWRIDVVHARSPEELDIRKRQPVLTAASTGTEGVKDPFVVRRGKTIHLFASYAAQEQLAPADRERAHAQADIYNAGVTIHPTGLATSIDGRSFTWCGQALGVGSTWDRYQARLSTVVSSGGAYIGLYDGSAGVQENYEERGGLAFSRDLRRWSRISDGPILTSPHGTGSLRYCSVIDMGSDLHVYYECAQGDGSHDLRVSHVPSSAFHRAAAEGRG